jgi:hypothetical protein
VGTPEIFPIGYSQINALKFLLLSLKSFVAEKRHVAMQKLFIKKRERVSQKWTSV